MPQAEEVEEVDPSVLVGTLLDGAPGQEFEIFHWLPDGKKVKTRVWLQMQRGEENTQALIDAQKSAKERGELQGYGDVYRESQAVEILQRAIRRPEKHTRPDGTSFHPHIFTDPYQLRCSMTEPAMAVLLNCYEIVKAKYGATESLEEREAETWIARMSDPLRGPFFLAQLDSRHWPGLISLLAGMLRDLYQRHGLPLPNSDGIWDSDQENSSSDTGTSGELPTASSMDDPDIEIPNDRQLSRDDARTLVHRSTPTDEPPADPDPELK
jgi:hypothetical protein